MANHKELCERLSADAGDVGKNYSSPIGHRIDDAVMLIEQQAARIQQQALEYVSLFEQCSEHLARIAELDLEREQAVAEAHGYRDCIAVLQRELEATRQERNAAGVKARRELMPAYEARIAELEKGRDALHENARQFYNLTQGDVTVIIRAPSAEKRNAIITASNRLRAALQAGKETR